MPEIKINATSNFKNFQFSGIENHVERNYKNDRNKFINPKLSSQNLNLSQANSYDLLRNHFQDLIKKHNKRCGQKHANRKYKSLKDFFKRKKGSPTKSVVTKFGTMKDKDTLLKSGITSKQLHTANNYGFYIYCKNFNLRHKYIKMGRAITNVDEKGADHVHWELIPLGHTPKGKASMGLSNALKNEYHTSNRIKAIHKFHEVEDPELINNMNTSYHHFHIFLPNINFKLSRTGNSWGLSEKVFERSMTKRDLINKQLRKSNQDLGKALNSALKQNSNLKQEVSNLISAYQKLDKANKIILKKYNQFNQSSKNIESKLNRFQSISNLSPKLARTLDNLSKEPKDSAITSFANLIKNHTISAKS